MHGLMHLPDDARKYGCLDNCSAFPYENYLHQLKKLVRSGQNPLAQILKRLSEIQNALPIRNEHTCKLDVKRPNNSYILNDRSCCEAVEITNQQDEQGCALVLCRVYERVTTHSVQPCDSRIIGVYKGTTRYNPIHPDEDDTCDKFDKESYYYFLSSKSTFYSFYLLLCVLLLLLLYYLLLYFHLFSLASKISKGILALRLMMSII